MKKTKNSIKKESIRPVDELTKETYSLWGKSLVFIRQTQIKTWQGIFILAFSAGALATIIWTVSFNVQPTSLAVSDLVSHWKLDETSGTVAYDSVGANNGTLKNGPKWVKGRIGNALSFDGVDDRVAIGDKANLDFGTNSFSYGMWVYVTSSVGDKDLAWWKGGVNATQKGYALELGTGNWLAKVSDGTILKKAAFGTQANFLGKWTHLFVVVDRSTNQMKLYVNGLPKTQVNIAGLSSLSNSKIATIGATSAGANFFRGLIDDVRIYGRALAANEISTLFPLIISCNDSDADQAPNDIFVKGSITYNYINQNGIATTTTKYDECIYDYKQIKEMRCENPGNSSNFTPTEVVVSCPVGCFDGACIAEGRCTDGTPFNQCSNNRPKFCYQSNLIDNCSLCGCLVGYTCRTDGTCYDPTSHLIISEASNAPPDYTTYKPNSVMVNLNSINFFNNVNEDIKIGWITITSSINNPYLTNIQLYDGGTLIAEAPKFNLNVVDFSGLNFTLPGKTTKNITIKADVASTTPDIIFSVGITDPNNVNASLVSSGGVAKVSGTASGNLIKISK